MAWNNPATWTVVDNIQGQNKPKARGAGQYTGPGGEQGYSPLTTPAQLLNDNYQTLETISTIGGGGGGGGGGW